ncbi:hypothetical protein OG453_07440 [Streptomyces sp. NBC_01381]|uniref:hypothetical protein n=1 Tax=Streptomyces sp. NBC_01381 TaxID=2903845 RepID=UPI002254FDDC|nr:hypothetical protein [Streptomyces sp. NBC_01381]MCX4666502.1 hypothetical protein [Streptomyces sp. NBC_01381]
MNDEILHWLQAHLGSEVDLPDLAGRYERLQSARAVAAEVLRERIAGLVAEPLKVTVNGVATIDNSPNVAALERQLAHLDDEVAPDTHLDGARLLASVQLVARPRR